MSTHATGPVIPEWTMSDRLRKARETTGMDARTFAEHVGISRNTVSNYEGGKTHRISRPMLAAWAMATGVSLEWLQHGTTPVLPDPESTQGGGDTISYPTPLRFGVRRGHGHHPLRRAS